MFSHSIMALESPLGRWLRSHHIDDAGTVASLFSEDELAAGQAADIISDELLVDEVSQRELIDSELKLLVQAARRSADRANDQLARRPTWELAAHQACKRLRAEAAERDDRWSSLVGTRRQSTPPPPPARPRYATARRREAAHAGDERGREVAEQREREKWLTELTRFLREWEAPCLHEAAQSSDPARAAMLLVGGRRVTTLRARVRELRRLGLWLRALHGVSKPASAAQVSDYLCDRFDQAGTKSAIASSWAALRFQEDLLGLTAAGRLTEHPLAQNARRELMSKAAARLDGTGRKQAPQPAAGLLMKMEDVVMEQAEDAYDRMICWWCLAASWACLRFDDHRGLPPANIVEYQDRYQLTFTRTKTTGSDKKVQLRPGVVSKSAYFRQEHWFATGWRLWQSSAPHDRDYYICPPARAGGCAHQEIGYPEFSARMRSAIASLRDENGDELGVEAAMYWTPHSFRAFLPSALSALGAGDGWLKWLTGWRATGAQLYARTGLSKTLTMQMTVAVMMRKHIDGDDPIGDRHNLEDLRAHLKVRGVTPSEEDRIVTALVVYPSGSSAKMLWPEGLSAEAGASASAAADENVGQNAAVCEEAGVSDVPTSGYVISVSQKRNIRCLHLIGACYRQPGISYLRFECLGDDCPPPTAYDTYCRGCWSGDSHPSGGRASGDKTPSTADSDSESSSSSDEP